MQKRNSDLDVVKGVLLLVMILYHAASVTSGSSLFPGAEAVTDRLSFILYAFITVAGYLCGWHYLPLAREKGARPVRRRLALRAVKLLGLLVLVNALVYLFAPPLSLPPAGKLLSSPAILLTLLNRPPGNLLAFEILYYIALFLALAALIPGRAKLLPVLTLAALVLAELYGGVPVWMLFGLTGLVAGLWAEKGYFDRAWGFLERTAGLPLLAAMIFYQAALPALHRSITGTGSSTALAAMYLLETLLWFLTAVFLLRPGVAAAVKKPVVLFGRYTLVGYIAQMLFLRAGFVLLAGLGVEGATLYAANAVTATLLLVLSLGLLDRLREDFSAVDAAYRVVFG